MSEKSDGFLCLMKARLQAYCAAWLGWPSSCCCFFCFNRSEEGQPFCKSEHGKIKRQPESDETIITNTSYNESFESESATPKSDSITTATGAITASPASPASPALNNKKETASDQSDVEGRIRALNQELVKRKREADQLKKEAKRRDKERLKAQEASLKKQIEAYDKYIDQVSREITREEADLKQGKSVRQPQIKQPADSKKLAKQKAESLTPPAGSYSSPEPPKLNRSESDSSKSSVEETIISSKPEVTSPGAEDVSQKQSPSPRGDRSPALDSSISENIYGTPTLSRYTSSSSTSRTDKKTSTPDRSSVPPSFDEKSPVKDDSSEVVDEAIDESVHTDVSVSGSGAMFKLDLGKKDEATKAEDKSSTTPRAGRTEATDYQTDTFAPDTGRSLTEDIAEESVQSEVEADISTKDDDTAPLFKLDLGKDDAKVNDEVKKEAAPSVHSETSEVKTETAAPDTVYSESDVSKPDSARSDVSKDSSAAPEKEDQPMPDSARSVKSALTEDEDDRSYSYSYSDSSRSEAEKCDKSKTYSEDFSTSQSSSKTASQSTSSASTRSTVTQSVSKPTKPAVEPEVKTPRDETAKESRVSSNKQSTDTDDDISEHFSDADIAEDLEGGDISERSGESPKFLVLDTTPTEKTFPEPELEKELDLSERLGASGASEVLADKPVAPVTQGESRVPEDGAGEAEVDESIAEDSELERIISSTAAAVEEFSAQIGAEESSEGSDNIFVDRESNKKDEVVTPTVAPASPVVESKDMSRTVLLEMVTDDAEDTTTDVEYVITPRTDDEEITAPPEEPKTEVKTPEPEVTEIEASPAEKNTAVDVTTKDLLNESFEAMISIHRRKRSSQSSEDEGLADEEVVPKLPALDLRDEGDTLEEKEPIERPEEPTPTSPEQESNLPKLKDPFDDDLFESKVSVGRGQSFPSFTAEPREIQAEETSDLDQLYDELGALTGDGDEWFDDDFGLGGIKTPPPYSSGKSDKSGSPSPSLKLQLQKVVPEPFYAVPHKTPEVHTLCGSAVNVYWEKRRYGESWSDVTIPDSYYGNSDMGNDNESMSRRAYKKLVFELTGDILREIYAEEEEDETGGDVTAQLGKGRKPRRKYFKGRTPPTHPDDVVPVVSQHVLNMLNLAETDKRPGPSRTKKWSSRKKRDAVDEVLLDELKEEEPQWVDYQQDELAVKMQVADSIFDNLLLECAQSMTSIMSRRKQGSTS